MNKLESLIFSHKQVILHFEECQRQFKQNYFVKNNTFHSGHFHKYYNNDYEKFKQSILKQKGTKELAEYLYTRNLLGKTIHNYKNKLNSLKQKLK